MQIASQRFSNPSELSDCPKQTQFDSRRGENEQQAQTLKN